MTYSLSKLMRKHFDFKDISIFGVLGILEAHIALASIGNREQKNVLSQTKVT